MMRIQVDREIHLSEIRPGDKPAYVEHLADKTIYDHTLRIPYPYTEAHADEWLALVEKTTNDQGAAPWWAIRHGELLIGCCGLESQGAATHRAELGYWLARPYWGRGIMTGVVGRICEYGFDELDLEKISAHVFAFNAASARVLEKCGFELEGYLKKHYLKDGRFIDARAYARLRASPPFRGTEEECRLKSAR